MTKLIVFVSVVFGGSFLLSCNRSVNMEFDYQEVPDEYKNSGFPPSNDFTQGNPRNQIYFERDGSVIETNVILMSLDNKKITSDYYIRKDSIFLVARLENKDGDFCNCIKKYSLRYKISNLSKDIKYSMFFWVDAKGYEAYPDYKR
jgi:hypothetical protein